MKALGQRRLDGWPAWLVGLCALAACSTSAGRGTTSSGPEVSAGDAGSDAGAALCTPYDAGWVTPGELDAGGQLIQTFGCQKCHGALLTGNNDGIRDPHSDAVQYPPNLSPDQATGLGCWTDGQIQNAILNNVDNQGNPICQPMPNFADAGMTIEDVTAIIAYLRVAVQPFVNDVPSGPSCCLFDLDCGDNGDCDQRECVDGGVPSAGTSGASGTSAGRGTSTGRPTGSSATAGASSTGGSSTGAPSSTTGGSASAGSAGLVTSSTTGTSAASSSGTSAGGTGSIAGTSGSGPGSPTSGGSTSTGVTSSGTTSAASTGST